MNQSMPCSWSQPLHTMHWIYLSFGLLYEQVCIILTVLQPAPASMLQPAPIPPPLCRRLKLTVCCRFRSSNVPIFKLNPRCSEWLVRLVSTMNYIENTRHIIEIRKITFYTQKAVFALVTNATQCWLPRICMVIKLGYVIMQ